MDKSELLTWATKVVIEVSWKSVLEKLLEFTREAGGWLVRTASARQEKYMGIRYLGSTCSPFSGKHPANLVGYKLKLPNGYMSIKFPVGCPRQLNRAV